MRNIVLLSLAGLALSLAGLLALLTGCGGSPAEVGGREPKPESKSAAKGEVSHWKQAGPGTRLYGMVLEQEGKNISAALYTLEDGDGLLIRQKESQGKFFPDRQAIIFPLYTPIAVPVEQWIAASGPHIVVPWTPGTSSLTGLLKDPSRSNSYTFSRLQSATLTNGLGAAAVAQ